MSVKEQLHGLIDRLDDEQAVQAIELLNVLVDDELAAERLPVDRTMGTAPPVLSGKAFRTQPPIDWPLLAAEQGVRPIGDLSELAGDFWPEDESIDDFVAAVREWRREGGCA